LVLKLCIAAIDEVKDPTEQALLQQKGLKLLSNLVETKAEAIAPKMMHSDKLIDFLLYWTEQVFEQADHGS
jgi:hypothetical protein